jgi:hypothetical protein
MSLIKTNTETQAIIEQVIVMGDLAKLNPEQRNVYYKSVCDSLGLNPLTRPFEYITLNGKLVLYARKDCTDQLRKLQNVSIRIVGRDLMDDLIVVTAEATNANGRTDSSIGAVSIQGLKGEAKANALMKAETKARRRVTLSLCGLGVVDESEIDSIPHARVGEPDRPTDAIVKHAVLAPEPAPLAVVDTARDPKRTVIDVESIEEHKGKNGPVWKVTTQAGDVYAAVVDSVAADLSEAMLIGHPVAITWERRGIRSIILTAEAVAE